MLDSPLNQRTIITQMPIHEANLSGEVMNLYPLSADELSKSYDMIAVLGQRTVIDAADKCVPANPPYADEHGIVGGEYRVQAAAAMCQILGMTAVEPTIHFSGNARQPLNMSTEDWRRLLVTPDGNKKRHGDLMSESDVYRKQFIEMLPHETGDELYLYKNYRCSAYAETTLDSLISLWAASCDGERYDKVALITNWFHQDRLQEFIRQAKRWKNAPGMYLPSGAKIGGYVPDPDTSFEVLSAERLLVTAYGEGKAHEIREAYFGTESIAHTKRRIFCEAAGLADIKRDRYISDAW